MARRTPSNGGAKARPVFSVRAFLDSLRGTKSVVQYGRGDSIFRQGDPCEFVLYIRTGGVKLSVLSRTGREAVVAVLGPGDFFGEGCLAGQSRRIGSATAITPSTILLVPKGRMAHLLRHQHALSDRFISRMVARSIQLEQDLIEQFVTSSEQRVARTLLRLARYGKQGKPVRLIPKVSQDTIAAMAGTTRSRVNVLLNQFHRQGFITRGGELPLRVNNSLLSVVLSLPRAG